MRGIVRHVESRPIMQRIHRWCTNLKERRVHLPQSNMGKALSYLLGNWEQIRGTRIPVDPGCLWFTFLCQPRSSRRSASHPCFSISGTKSRARSAVRESSSL